MIIMIRVEKDDRIIIIIAETALVICMRNVHGCRSENPSSVFKISNHMLILMDWLPSLAPPLQSLAQKPHILSGFLHSCFLLLIGYLTMLITFQTIQTRRQRAWILTLISSLVMSVGSLPTVVHFLWTSGGDLRHHPTQWWDLDVYLCCFFVAYLVMDLGIGVVHYPDQIHLLSGWIHHVLYAVLVMHLLDRSLTTSFCLMLPLELPTFVLALGRLFKELRNDGVFGGMFFSTRIVYHAWMIWRFWEGYSVEGQWWLVVAGVYPLHWYWFKGWVRQQRDLKKKKKAKSAGVEGEGVVVCEKESKSDC